ncbi:ribonuclease H-like domain-containing protein [Tanacetum coccineum]
MHMGASSHLADNTSTLISFSNSSIYPSVFVGNDHSIPVTHTGHIRQFTRDNDVYVEFDAYGFLVKDYRTEVFILRCDLVPETLPGLKQAPRAWFQRFASYATRVGFQHSKTDSSLFVFLRGSDIDYLLLYVDDIILTASSSAFLQRIITSLHSEFAMTDLGSLNYFLGISAQRSATGLFLSQSKFTEKILERAHMQNCNPCRTPVDTESKLGADGDPVGPNLLSQPCGYLSRSYVLIAEYRGVANVVAETAWIRNLLCELYTPLFTATLVYCDNVNAVYMSANPVQHQRIKHIEIDIHFVRDFVASGQVRVLHVPSRFQYTDIFTKCLPTALFIEFRSSLNV